jgi:hypothetical protein
VLEVTEISLPLAFIAFVVSGIAASFAQARFIDALVKESDEVSSNAAMQDQFLDRPTRAPIASFSETRRRIRALTVRREDEALEGLRKQAIASIVASLGAFAWILLAMTLHI